MMKEHSSGVKKPPLQKNHLLSLLTSWVNINTGSDNMCGITGFCASLKLAFSSLNGTMKLIPLPPRKKLDSKGTLTLLPTADALHISKRKEAKFKILFGGHMDTVYPATSPFQNAEPFDDHLKLRGPGVADMKGGILILLKGLQIFESCPLAKNIGWEILLTPDEEIGSVSSQDLWLECAKRCDMGIIFEPSLEDGSFISQRKGSMNLCIVMQGKTAHAGRDFSCGRNAIAALSEFVVRAHALNFEGSPLTLNIGTIEGGSAFNVVPDFALCKLNMRADSQEIIETTYNQLEEILESIALKAKTTFKMHKISYRPPKYFDSATEHLFNTLKQCGQNLGIDIKWRPSGGACDGNILAMANVPTIDTFGPIGGHLHTDKEYILIDSLPQRAHLLSLFLMQLAAKKEPL